MAIRVGLWSGAALLAACVADVGIAADPPFDPAEFRAAVCGNTTQILVLGSRHLADEGEEFRPESLEPLLQRLRAFAPSAILIETLPGEILFLLSSYETIYPEVAGMFGEFALRSSRASGAALGMTMPQAAAAAEALLHDRTAPAGPSRRRRLAALFLAAGDPHSALVQWLQLAEAERVRGDGVTAETAEMMSRFSSRRNESVTIAVALAVRLGLERVHPIDDHSESDLILSVLDEFAAAEQSAEMQAARALARRDRPPMTSPESTLQLFRELNSNASGRADAEQQWLSRLTAREYSAIQRRRVAAWETRNLRMAAHIREASAIHPGQRILVIVGSSHKPHLDAYLRMMSDVEVVDAGAILD